MQKNLPDLKNILKKLYNFIGEIYLDHQESLNKISPQIMVQYLCEQLKNKKIYLNIESLFKVFPWLEAKKNTEVQRLFSEYEKYLKKSYILRISRQVIQSQYHQKNIFIDYEVLAEHINSQDELENFFFSKENQIFIKDTFYEISKEEERELIENLVKFTESKSKRGLWEQKGFQMLSREINQYVKKSLLNKKTRFATDIRYYEDNFNILIEKLARFID